MAVSGGVTAAYACEVIDGEMITHYAARLRSQCATVDDALLRLARGERVVVAGCDMAALRTRLAGLGIGQACE